MATSHSVSHGEIPEVLEAHYHGEEEHLRVILNVPPMFEGLAGALYMDGSGSMDQSQSYGTRSQAARSTGLFARFWKQEAEGDSVEDNLVKQAMQVLVPYIAGLDANGQCRIAYWACGSSGSEVEVIGELDAQTGSTEQYGGPRRFGSYTYVLPAVRDFVAYVKGLVSSGEPVQNALLVLVTDGLLHDEENLIAYCNDLCEAVDANQFPNAMISIIGVGPQVDLEQLERLHHECGEIEKTEAELVHVAHAEQLDELAEVVSHLISEQQIAFSGGAKLLDEDGSVLVTYETDVPAVLSCRLPAFSQPKHLRLVATNGAELAFTVQPDDDED
jgi:hypothetical protein